MKFEGTLEIFERGQQRSKSTDSKRAVRDRVSRVLPSQLFADSVGTFVCLSRLGQFLGLLQCLAGQQQSFQQLLTAETGERILGFHLWRVVFDGVRGGLRVGVIASGGRTTCTQTLSAQSTGALCLHLGGCLLLLGCGRSSARLIALGDWVRLAIEIDRKPNRCETQTCSQERRNPRDIGQPEVQRCVHIAMHLKHLSCLRIHGEQRRRKKKNKQTTCCGQVRKLMKEQDRESIESSY
mmetsp:Transcript_12086/g.36666  ORF Transcript_12086/g.36666 Transcript_12086/m.36666 type:complete len:238 (-) Transcript_12086:58-771(-)